MKHPHKVINILRKKAMKLHRKTNEKFIFIGTFLSLSLLALEVQLARMIYGKA